MLFNIHFQKRSKAVTVEENDDWGFSHDVTNIQTKKLSIFLSFTFFRYYSTCSENLFLQKFLVAKGIHFKDAWIFQTFGGVNRRIPDRRILKIFLPGFRI